MVLQYYQQQASWCWLPSHILEGRFPAVPSLPSYAHGSGSNETPTKKCLNAIFYVIHRVFGDRVGIQSPFLSMAFTEVLYIYKKRDQTIKLKTILSYCYKYLRTSWGKNKSGFPAYVLCAWRCNPTLIGRKFQACQGTSDQLVSECGRPKVCLSGCLSVNSTVSSYVQ